MGLIILYLVNHDLFGLNGKRPVALQVLLFVVPEPPLPGKYYTITSLTKANVVLLLSPLLQC